MSLHKVQSCSFSFGIDVLVLVSGRPRISQIDEEAIHCGAEGEGPLTCYLVKISSIASSLFFSQSYFISQT